MVVTTVTLGLGSRGASGRNSQYTRIWPGLNMVKRRRHSGVGSQTAISQTSLAAFGCARASALFAPSTCEKYRSGDEERGDESTLTRFADGVEGVASMFASNSR